MKKILLVCLILVWHTSVLLAENWMSRLPDDAYVAALSIPGAHDAATGYGFSGFIGLFGNRYARTQDLDISQQWAVGVRAFDLRPSVYKDYINIHHGIMPTKMRFDQALKLLCDSLQRNPSEFVIIHMLHAADGDKVKNTYNTRIQQLLRQDRFKRFLVDFRPDLKVREMRGKILILSRDHYSDSPIGGIFIGWTGGINWQRQTAGAIIGTRGVRGKLYVQDFSATHFPNGVTLKVKALTQMLDSSTRMLDCSIRKLDGSAQMVDGSARKHDGNTRMNPADAHQLVWVFNFASAYSKVETLFGRKISLSNGYRDNATHTHKAILDYLANHPAGPTGIILMDFVGTDESNDYHTRGAEVVQAIIRNNFRYLTREK